MNILLVSECSGRAINETRRILDQFAERRGERTWQTPITQQGLMTLRKLLRKTARKNTAVACHWIRGRDHSELLWIVGNARRFNPQGTVPTNTTRRDVLRRADENDWHSGEDISLLMQLAALLHDLGKASVAFQERLRNWQIERNLYRHEWVSLRLFLAFVGKDDDAMWLHRLANPSAEDDASWLAPDRFFRDGIDALVRKPFEALPPLAAAVAWLVVTHHRLLTFPVERDDPHGWFGKKSTTHGPGHLGKLWGIVDHRWNDWDGRDTPPSANEVLSYWQMHGELPVVLPKWRARAAKVAARLQALLSKPGKGDWLSDPYIMHIARMGLMLADHHYSSLKPNDARRLKGDEACSLFANTDAGGALKQRLDEHLLGVARDAALIAHSLPSFADNLPRLLHKTLRKRSGNAEFRWQDKAFDAAEALRDKARDSGAFIVNMASTGRGKTIANARIMHALSDPLKGMRCSFAVGLRTLTLQTGREYQRYLGLQEDEFAIRVGGSANRRLFEYHEAKAERTGSASRQKLIDEDSAVFYEGNVEAHPLLRMAMGDERIGKLLSAPILVCTIDHLTPATEAQRAGRQIAPMLRLMSSDLVLDEPDDFDIDDLPALTRLVHWAGLLGSKVLLSSATLPPDLVRGLFESYRQGRMHFQRNRGAEGGHSARAPDVACLWVDEFRVETADCSDADQYNQAHTRFVDARVGELAKQPAKRIGELLPLSIEPKDKPRIRRAFAGHVRDAVVRAHDIHAETHAESGKRVSFGLVRMANIGPLYDVARELFRLGAPEGYRIHLCVYHSQFPLLLRSSLEHALDSVLGQRTKRDVFALPDVREALNSGDEANHVFVVLASPVAEVGRDHDYDWAVVEPSSMRSLIQLAGRVRRHREAGNGQPNVFVFQRNIKSFESRDGRAFVRPGFEGGQAPGGRPFNLKSHVLGELLREEEWGQIDARPRIRPPDPLQPFERLVDLEHVRLRLQMSARISDKFNAASIWTQPLAHLTWALPQQQPFRDDNGRREQVLAFLPNEDGERLVIHRVDEKRLRRGEAGAYTTAETSIRTLDLDAETGPRIAPWFRFEVLSLLEQVAEAEGCDLDHAARRFTITNVPMPASRDAIAHWQWHPVLGFNLAG